MVDVYARFEDGGIVHLPKILPTVFVPRLIEEMDCPVQWNLGNSTITWPSESEEDVQKDIDCFDLDAMSKKTTSYTKKPH